MKTTHLLNPDFQIRNSKSYRIFPFMNNGMIKALILLFYILFLSQIVKSQNAITANTGTLTAMSTISSSQNTIKQDNSVTTKSLSHKATDTARSINNNELKARAMINSYFKGIDDADDNYKAKKSGKAVIFVSTVIGTPVVGLLPTIACSSITPSRNNLDVPKSKLINDDSYMRGYIGEARYIKKHNTWPCYVLASILWLGIAGIILR